MKNLHEYKAKLENRLEEYMEMPVNAHNIEVIEDTMMCLKCLDEYKMTGEGHEKWEMSKRLDKQTAEEWTRKMKNADDSRGGHWTMEQTEDVRKQHGYSLDPVEFYAAMNMCYSDYCEVARAFGVNSVGFYAELANAFLDDKDANDGKIALYYEYIAK